MNAKVERDGDVLVVHLQGYLDYETIEPFRLTCLKHLAQEQVVFSLRDLSFVGSKGITDFIETLVHLSKRSQAGLRFCEVPSEFRRVLEASEVDRLQIFENKWQAKQSFFQPTPALEPLVPYSISYSSMTPEEDIS